MTCQYDYSQKRMSYTVSKHATCIFWCISCHQESCSFVPWPLTSAVSHIGLGPSEARVGNVVCFVEDTSTPFALRPREGYVALAGESYVHKFVDEVALCRI